MSRGKGKARREQVSGREMAKSGEGERQNAGPVPEENEDHDSGQQTSYSFTLADEERLVDFFRANPCFYDKTLDLYSNVIHKRKLMQDIAAELSTTVAKVNGWFKNQRTAVGKLLKKKSGQALEVMTARKRWQMQNFNFLKDHIVPRTFTSDTATLPSSQPRASRGDSSSEEEDPVSERSISNRAYVPGQKKRLKKIDSMIEEFMSRPRPSEEISQKIEAALATSSVGPQDERTALGNWLMARMSKVPDERWEAFTEAAQNLMREFTKPVMHPPQAPETLFPRIASQQHWQQTPQQYWQHTPQQYWQQPLQQTWQDDSPRCQSTPMRQVQQASDPIPRPHSAGPHTAGSSSGESFGNLGLSDSFMKQLHGAASESTPASQRVEEEVNVSD